MTCRGKGSQTELAGCTWNGKEAEQRINTDLTESSKSPASIAKSNKQWGDLLVSGGVQTPSDKLRSSYSVMSK